MNKNQHIRDFLRFYCEMPMAPQYAVLLNGPWGSGKTWFAKNFIENDVPEVFRPVYVSLYGVQSFEDMETEFFRVIHPILGSKSVRVLGRVVRGMLKATINLDLDGDGKVDGSVSGGGSPTKIIDSISLSTENILFLDDLERCSIPVVDLLGYLNQLVEHGGMKVVIIANEREIREVGDSAAYARVKEKLIGRTFEVAPDLMAALSCFALEIPNEKTRIIVAARSQLIEQVYRCSAYQNLRIIKQALWEFDRLVIGLEGFTVKSDQLLSDLLVLFCLYSMEIRSGSMIANQIVDFQDPFYTYDINKVTEGLPSSCEKVKGLRDKYAGLNLNVYLLDASVWVEVFNNGALPFDKINTALRTSKYFQKENQPNWVRLWYGQGLSDAEFPVVLANVRKEWCIRQFKEVEEVIHVFGMFVSYIKRGVCDFDIDQIIGEGQQYVVDLMTDSGIHDVGPRRRRSLFEGEGYSGLGYMGREEAEFIQFLEFINFKRQELYELSLPSKADELLRLIEIDPYLFQRRIILSNDSENIYYETAILHLIPALAFVAAVIKAQHTVRMELAYALKDRYRFSQFCGALAIEYDWIMQVEEIVKAEVELRKGKISAISLKAFVDVIATAKDQLDSFRRQHQ